MGASPQPSCTMKLGHLGLQQLMLSYMFVMNS
jgi:hypothetical protein